jgi:hypothetical protein
MKRNSAGRAVFGPRTSALYKGVTVLRPPHALIPHLANLLRLFASRAPCAAARRQARTLRWSSVGSIQRRSGPLLGRSHASPFFLCFEVHCLRRSASLLAVAVLFSDEPLTSTVSGTSATDLRSVSVDPVISLPFCSSGRGRVIYLLFPCIFFSWLDLREEVYLGNLFVGSSNT